MKLLLNLTLTFLLFAINISLFAINNPDSTKTSANDNVDPKTVLEKYLDAIGGRDALAKVEDRTTIMRGTAMGQNLTIIVKQKAPNKMRQEMKVAGMDQITIFDGEKGMMKAGPQNIEITDKELEQLKIESYFELLLDPESYGITITYEGVEKENEKELDKIKFTLPSGIRWFSYFDKLTGLKTKEIKELQTKMGLIEQTITYDDYRNVDEIKYPFKIKQSFGAQSIDLTVSSIKINKGISDDTFEIKD
jgi:outer membrane lipoprotein-sorting protein